MARTATPETFFDAAMRLLAGPGLPALRLAFPLDSADSVPVVAAAVTRFAEEKWLG